MALTSTVTFRTTPELKERVDNLAKRTRRSAGFYHNQPRGLHLQIEDKGGDESAAML